MAFAARKDESLGVGDGALGLLLMTLEDEIFPEASTAPRDALGDIEPIFK